MVEHGSARENIQYSIRCQLTIEKGQRWFKKPVGVALTLKFQWVEDSDGLNSLHDTKSTPAVVLSVKPSHHEKEYTHNISKLIATPTPILFFFSRLVFQMTRHGSRPRTKSVAAEKPRDL